MDEVQGRGVVTPPAREVAVCFTFQKYAHPNETWFVLSHGATEDEATKVVVTAKEPDEGRWDLVEVQTFVNA